MMDHGVDDNVAVLPMMVWLIGLVVLVIRRRRG